MPSKTFDARRAQRQARSRLTGVSDV